ncbi:MAG: PSP1 domain-containing protein [Bacilli bacterium]|jgi:cell fate regulator YaaT (PSP1 superfamily)
MVKVVGIGFKEVGKIYWFDPKNFQLKKGDNVIVETVRGIEIGEVIEDIKEVDEKSLEHELKPIMRIASQKDIERQKENEAQALKDNEVCKKLIAEHNLEMKLLGCEYTLDRQKIIIYYNAEGRIDFRELLKDLAANFRARIELRQIGPREGAKIVGGIGTCGRCLCCTTHIRDFDVVSMKMAKDQGMNLSSNKITGVCGKLMCCIAYEFPIYEELRKTIPGVGEIVDTPDCEGCKVSAVNYVSKKVTVVNEDKQQTFDAKEVVRKNKPHHHEKKEKEEKEEQDTKETLTAKDNQPQMPKQNPNQKNKQNPNKKNKKHKQKKPKGKNEPRNNS